ncbi:RpiB/LacA/LacB family sugar-phosphate isomerase [Candidatus Curtissbacteria bacterium]|nr:RpiB/LacA/LacB family sugar-phosphate isomerase [Candidatus Curtissbacteria bacterium]
MANSPFLTIYYHFSPYTSSCQAPEWSIIVNVEIGKEASKKVLNGEVDQGVLFCRSGTGICMAANKINGIRATLCWDAETARLARKWDDANVICISLRATSEKMAREILEAWFSTKFDEEGLNEAHNSRREGRSRRRFWKA